ncbi:MAG: N5-carboxyaminoimidazole ribonucleotide mutase [Candidatus Nomurabacteria bacterium GW2011_GWF2_43_24]|uniref:N5-carboxyaminoimidazole ribonucleotide mutase n=1 Tax=Candidatus Nomurabacteria bacterium GW2011_GWF2_43_24 TaxID=1618778 RepID=A0A0G1EPY7_9BACT|nr:MAG: N5-carboxyaminoimidazole ribonucleotide mutase [Candidatus Nomurabacteria bacterium GW2011_GWF2_43_24]
MPMKNNPKVGIIMGSDSDLEVMAEAAKILEEFGVGYEITVGSAHRSPELIHKYITTIQKQGIKIIIAGAGGAAHLAGVAASLATLPVIGIPIKAKTLDGLDSLLSTVNMPPGEKTPDCWPCRCWPYRTKAWKISWLLIKIN